jgi:MtrB/PioB family decaheme-associated outer membrane protein
MGGTMNSLRLTTVLLAVLAAWTTARAEEPRTTQASISAGVGIVSGDDAQRSLFGQYNGLRTHGAIGLFGVELERRDDEAGRVLSVEGVNLFGETRALDLRWKQQGQWKFAAGYNEGVRHEPYSASNGADLQLKRTRLGLALSRVINARLQLDVNLSSENKSGARIFGIGMTCPTVLAPTCRGTTGTETGWALLMLPEPIDANHSQIEARLTFNDERFSVNGGYYGSFYRNALDRLDPSVPSTLNNPLGTPLPLASGLQEILSRPVALPPDNQAQQLDIGGQWRIAPRTQLDFKLAYAQATQHQDFAASGFTDAPAGVSNLGGRVDTTRAQLSLSTRPWPKLSLLAKLRYEDRRDLTPIAPYNVEGSATYTNRRLPYTTTHGLLQASYPFSSDYRGTLAADIETIDRGVFTASSAVAGLSALRQKTSETGVRAELRRRMSESFGASIGVASGRRDGSNWLRDNSGIGVTEVSNPSDPAAGFATAIFMPTLADRQRDSVKLQADWQPSDSVSLQLVARNGRDRFSTPSVYGLRSNDSYQLSLDASYAWSEAWSFTGGLSYGHETLLQARPGAAIVAYSNNSSGATLGVTGRPNSKLELGADLSYANDRSVYAQTLDATADAGSAALLAATGGLPDIVFRQVTLKLFGRYTVDKQSELRLDLVHQRSTWTDWAFGYNGVPFSYSDGTTLGQPPRQHVTLLALRYVHRW